MPTVTEKRKYRTNISKGRKVEVRTASISLADAKKHLATSKRGGAWAQFRAAINDSMKLLKENTAISLDAQIDGHIPSDNEVASIENSMNKYLERDLESHLALRYCESVNKFILAPRSEIQAVLGVRKRRNAVTA